MQLEHKITRPSLYDLGGFSQLPVRDNSIVSIWLPLPQTMFEEVVVVSSDETAWAEGDQLVMNVVGLGSRQTARFANELSNLRRS
jgi:hypothetical protein